jgi:hypothetical protein
MSDPIPCFMFPSPHYWRAWRPLGAEGRSTSLDVCVECGAIGERSTDRVFAYDLKAVKEALTDLPMEEPK